MTFCTYPNLTDPSDLYVLIFSLIFVVASISNNLQIPFFKRSGGLLDYGKFASDVSFSINVPSRIGYTVIYFPAALIGFYFLLLEEDGEGGEHKSRGVIGASMIAVHFSKRTLETLFLHKYSGYMPLSTALFVSTGYTSFAIYMCIYSLGREAFGLSDVYLKYAILIAFTMGQIGNFHHHYLLSQLRRPGEKDYKVPHGALFEYVAAPHYFFEIIAITCMVIVAQHMTILIFFVGDVTYLCDRAIAQSEWNLENLKGKYPSHRKHMIPYIF